MGNCYGSKTKKQKSNSKSAYEVKENSPSLSPAVVAEKDQSNPSFRLELKQVPQSFNALSLTHLPDEEANTFPKYYQKIQDKLSGHFEVKSEQIATSFHKRLSQIYGISEQQAKAWIMCYLDYMILLSWHIVQKKPVKFYSPIAVQLVTKLHVVYHESYQNFCKILLGNNGMIQFSPCKMIVKRDDRLLEELSNTYMLTRSAILSLVYNNPEISKPEKDRKQAESIWEPFTITSLKNEFSFAFLSESSRKKFIQFLLENESKIRSEGHSVEEILEAGNTLRKEYGLDNLHSPTMIPNIINTFKKPPGGSTLKNATRVDQVVFSEEFLKLLAWEQLINVSEALIWILEYKKFLFLLLENTHPKASSKGPIYPSEKVEQVWQLHMQFTEGYSRDIITNLNILSYPLRDNSIKYQQSYMSLNKAYEFYFGNMNERYWPQATNYIVGKVGMFHLYFARDLLSNDKKKIAIKKFLKYSKKVGQDPLSKMKPDEKFQILERDNILTLLKAESTFFEIAYEEEDSETIESLVRADSYKLSQPSPKKDSHKEEGPFSEENMDKDVINYKKLKGGHFKPLAEGSKIQGNHQGDEDDINGLPDILFQDQAD